MTIAVSNEMLAQRCFLYGNSLFCVFPYGVQNENILQDARNC